MTAPIRFAIAILLPVFAGGPALASPCTDAIDPLAARLNEAAETVGAVSTSGKAVAASREGQAQTGGEDRPVGTPGAPSNPGESQAARQAAEAGGGGDRVMQARALLNKARALDQDGNGAGCLATVGDAKRLLDEAR
jgi:hypothetical protein